MTMVPTDLEHRAKHHTRFDTTHAAVPRVYDGLLGGKDNFGADRTTAGRVLEVEPAATRRLYEALAFRARALRYLGPRLVLDLGSGLPTTTKAIHLVLPKARVIYVDNDPMVCSHLRALVAPTEVFPCDVTRLADLWEHPTLAGTLNQRMTTVLTMVLHFLPRETAADLIRQLARLLAPGSHVICSVGVADPDTAASLADVYDAAATFNHPPATVAGWFEQAGLTLAHPGVSTAARWHPYRPAPATLPTIDGLQVLSLVATKGLLWRPSS
jgi:SAM-dependent methyltransferase